MLLQNETRLASCYGIALIAAVVSVILLSSGQASLNLNKFHDTQKGPDSPYRVAYDGDDILMGHPALKKYMRSNPRTDEIVKVLLSMEANPIQSTYFSNYTIQYQAPELQKRLP